ncbi:MAG: flavoprotein [Pseudonocardiaceae bacterium]
MHCLATPAAVEHFLDVPALTELTGHPVRTTYRTSDDEALPRADAIIVAPVTYNTINKWATGVADNYVLNQLAELTGLGAHIVVLPFRQPRAGGQPGIRPQHRRITPGRRAGPVRTRRVRATPAAHGPHSARRVPVESGPCGRTRIAPCAPARGAVM